MNCFFVPVNLKHWDMFQKVKQAGHIETFLATKEIQLGDVMLLYVGKQDPRYASGVYAIGIACSEQYIPKNHPEEYCNNRNSVDVRIIAINYEKPYISHEVFSHFTRQLRSVHKISPMYYPDLQRILEENEIIVSK